MSNRELSTIEIKYLQNKRDINELQNTSLMTVLIEILKELRYLNEK